MTLDLKTNKKKAWLKCRFSASGQGFVQFVQPLYAGSEDVLGVRGSFCDVCTSLWAPEGAHLNYEN